MIGFVVLVRIETGGICYKEFHLPYASQVEEFVYVRRILKHIEHFELLVIKLIRLLNKENDIFILPALSYRQPIVLVDAVS